MSDIFDADYYLNGKATGKSNYENYSWKPDLTLPMADHLKRALRVKDGDSVLDCGCARGYLVKALRMRGVNAFGYDISEWAIANCDEGVKGYVSTNLPRGSFDFIIAKDVMEHVPEKDLFQTLAVLTGRTRKSLLLIVPLTHHVGGPFLRDEDNADPSHLIMWPLEKWMDLLTSVVRPDEGHVSGSWHYPGLKPASSETPKSCGFIQFTRV